MGMDSSDFKLVQAIKGVNEDMLKTLRQLTEGQRRALENDARLADAFNRMATAMETLTREVRGLREDMNPQMDKPKKKLAAAAKPEAKHGA